MRIDERQQFVLLAGQHGACLSRAGRSSRFDDGVYRARCMKFYQSKMARTNWQRSRLVPRAASSRTSGLKKQRNTGDSTHRTHAPLRCCRTVVCYQRVVIDLLIVLPAADGRSGRQILRFLSSFGCSYSINIGETERTTMADNLATSARIIAFPTRAPVPAETVRAGTVPAREASCRHGAAGATRKGAVFAERRARRAAQGCSGTSHGTGGTAWHDAGTGRHDEHL